jgi:hypothetical protein
MVKLTICILAVLVNCFLSVNFCIAQDQNNSQYLISQDSIGIAKLGKPLKEFLAEAKDLGYIVKESKYDYLVYDRNNLPLLTITIFSSYPKSKPIRTIKTTSSKFVLDNGKSLIGTTLGELAKEYPEVSIFRINLSAQAPELVDFKGWPFSESVVKDKYLIKYETILNKISDEYGNIKPVGKYPNEFSLYTNEYLPEATIESFQIEGIEPKIKFKGKDF